MSKSVLHWSNRGRTNGLPGSAHSLLHVDVSVDVYARCTTSGVTVALDDSSAMLVVTRLLSARRCAASSAVVGDVRQMSVPASSTLGATDGTDWRADSDNATASVACVPACRAVGRP